MKEIYDLMDESINQLNEIKKNLTNHDEEVAINIIIDDSDPQNPVFVEIEKDNGESISIGEDSRTDENYRKLRITVGDVIGQNAFEI